MAHGQRAGTHHSSVTASSFRPLMTAAHQRQTTALHVRLFCGLPPIYGLHCCHRKPHLPLQCVLPYTNDGSRPGSGFMYVICNDVYYLYHPHMLHELQGLIDRKLQSFAGTSYIIQIIISMGCISYRMCCNHARNSMIRRLFLTQDHSLLALVSLWACVHCLIPILSSGRRLQAGSKPSLYHKYAHI